MAIFADLPQLVCKWRKHLLLDPWGFYIFPASGLPQLYICESYKVPTQQIRRVSYRELLSDSLMSDIGVIDHDVQYPSMEKEQKLGYG